MSFLKVKKSFFIIAGLISFFALQASAEASREFTGKGQMPGLEDTKAPVISKVTTKK